MKPCAVVCSPGYTDFAEFQAKGMWIYSAGSDHIKVRNGEAEQALIGRYTQGTTMKMEVIRGDNDQRTGLLGGCDSAIIFWDGKPGDTFDVMRAAMQSGLITITVPVKRYD